MIQTDFDLNFWVIFVFAPQFAAYFEKLTLPETAYGFWINFRWFLVIFVYTGFWGYLAISWFLAVCEVFNADSCGVFGVCILSFTSLGQKWVILDIKTRWFLVTIWGVSVFCWNSLNFNMEFEEIVIFKCVFSVCKQVNFEVFFSTSFGSCPVKSIRFWSVSVLGVCDQWQKVSKSSVYKSE